MSDAVRNGKNGLLSRKCPSSKFGCCGTGSCGRDGGGDADSDRHIACLECLVCYMVFGVVCLVCSRFLCCE